MTNVYLKDFEDWDAFNSVYVRYFAGRLPLRVAVQIGELGFGHIEISMVAQVRDTRTSEATRVAGQPPKLTTTDGRS
jgi:hypothetical protein